MKSQKIIIEQRERIDKITEKLIELIAERKKLTFKISELKKKSSIPSIDHEREKKIISNAKKLAKKFKVSPSLVENIMKLLINDSRKTKVNLL